MMTLHTYNIRALDIGVVLDAVDHVNLRAVGLVLVTGSKNEKIGVGNESIYCVGFSGFKEYLGNRHV